MLVINLTFLKSYFYLKFCVCVYVSVCICTCVSNCVGNCGVQKRVSDPLDLEFKEVVNCMMWVLGIKVTSSANERVKKARLGLCAPCGRYKFSG